jgi:hypothetical protein
VCAQSLFEVGMTDARRIYGSWRSRQGSKHDRYSAEKESRRAGGETWPEIREERRRAGRRASEARGKEIQRAQDERNQKSGSKEDSGEDDDKIGRQVASEMTGDSDRARVSFRRSSGVADSSPRSVADPRFRFTMD